MSSDSHSDSKVTRIESAVTRPLAELGFDLEAVEITPAGKRRVLRIAIDSDDGVSMDDVADATRAISEVLDADDVMGAAPYTLEVTSRGVDRPLTLPRHWRRNAGRLVACTLADGTKVSGRIVESDDDGVLLKVGDTDRRLPYDEIARAVVQIEFTRRTEED